MTQPLDTEAHKITLFEALGGEAVITRLVARFYEVMDTDPKAAHVRAIHPSDLSSAQQKLTLYLIGWTGGPQLYVEKYGHPRLRARHLPFSINETARDQWMYCMIRAMHDVGVDEKIVIPLSEALWGLADHMRNSH